MGSEQWKKKGLSRAAADCQDSQSFWEPSKCGQLVVRWQIREEALQHAAVLQGAGMNEWL